MSSGAVRRPSLSVDGQSEANGKAKPIQTLSVWEKENHTRVVSIQATRALIFIALIILNSLAIQGNFGGMWLFISNMGLVAIESAISYFERPDKIGNLDLRKYKWAYIILNIGLSVAFNSLGLTKQLAAPLLSSPRVGVAQLVTSLVLPSIFGCFLTAKTTKHLIDQAKANSPRTSSTERLDQARATTP